MIDEKKLIEDIEKEIEFAMKCNMPDMVAGMRRIASIIENQPKIGEWIPCSERLPEEDEFYLATLDGEIVGEENPFSGLAEFENGKWIDDEEDYHCVLAWQPLPKPFQPKKNRTNCKNRHENGNCLVVGGFCTAVHDEHCQYQQKGEREA